MTPRTMLVLAAGVAAVAGPAAASATMAYVSMPAKVTGPSYVMVANDDGSGATRIARGNYVSISPDGARVAYTSGNNPVNTVYDLATGATATLKGTCQYLLTWSPDSTMIACTTQSAKRNGDVTGNGLGIAQIPASLDGVTTIPVNDYIAAPGNAVGMGTAFSPDSTRIAFSLMKYSSHAPAGTLYVAPVTDATARTAVLARGSSPVWSTFGIAAMRSTNVTIMLGRSRTRMVRSQVWTISPDLSSARQLTHYKARGLMSGPGPAAWSPLGNLIVGGIGGEDVSDLATFAVPGGATRNLLGGTIVNAAAVSADGQRLLFETGLEGGPYAIKTTGLNGKGTRTLVKRASSVSVTPGWDG